MRLGDLDKLEIGLRNMAKYQRGERQQGILGCCETIRLAPTVDAVPVRRGEWVKMTGMMPPEYHGHYECSLCGWHGKHYTKEWEYNYCPNCGAKMEPHDVRRNNNEP